MKIVQIGFRDTAGSGYCLAHAINKLTRHKAVNIRFIDTYLRYPTMIEAGDYTRQAIRKMLYKADVVHFHIHVKPFFSSLQLNPAKFKDKKTLVYYHGTMLRTYKDELVKQAYEYLPDHTPTVSTPALLKYVGKNAVWLPVCRSFEEISARYGASVRDLKAVESFKAKRMVTFGHPTTSVEKKGSKTFFAALTNIVRGNPNIKAVTIFNTAWDACLRRMSRFDVVLDEAVLGTYGLTTVEAAIFKLPVVSLLTRETAKLYKELAGEAPPLVTWRDQGDLEEKLYVLAERPDVRAELGQQVHDYMLKIHDEPAIVQRYLNIINLKK